MTATPPLRSAHLRTLALTLFVVLSNVAGNSALSWGVKRESSLVNIWLPAGVLLLMLCTVSRMALLSWADLSYVLPVTSVGYALNALAGRLFLGERISTQRWLGTALIVGGTVMVGLTRPRSTEKPG